MRLSRKLAITGAVTLAVAGTALAAGAEKQHILNVAMPDGSVAQIHYTGDVAPHVVLQPTAKPVDLLSEAADPFLAFDRIAAMMDAQSEAMLASARSTAAAPPGVTRTGAGADMPAGAISYSCVSSSSNGGGCTQSYRMTSFAPDAAPKVETSQSGDCRNVRTLVPVVLGAQAAPAEKAPAQPAPVAPPKPQPEHRDLRDTI
jgi:hypothetical protein